MEDDLYEDDEYDDRFDCDGCEEVIEQNDQGLAIIFVDKISNKPVHGLLFVHMSDRCKELVVGSPMGNWSDTCDPKYIL